MHIDELGKNCKGGAPFLPPLLALPPQALPYTLSYLHFAPTFDEFQNESNLKEVISDRIFWDFQNSKKVTLNQISNRLTSSSRLIFAFAPSEKFKLHIWYNYNIR